MGRSAAPVYARRASAVLEEGPARAARPGWQPDLAQNFIRLERRRQIADEELFGFQYSLSPAAADDEVGVQCGDHRGQLRRLGRSVSVHDVAVDSPLPGVALPDEDVLALVGDVVVARVQRVAPHLV